jgi:hypothetical protein
MAQPTGLVLERQLWQQMLQTLDPPFGRASTSPPTGVIDRVIDVRYYTEIHFVTSRFEAPNLV